MEWGVLVLWHFLYLAIELGSGCLIDLTGVGESELAYGLDDAENAYCIDIGCELG